MGIIIVGVDSFSTQRFNIVGSIFDFTNLGIDYPVEKCKITVVLFGSMLPDLSVYRVTEEA